jgi:ppGpp synthetase/RelA/SpoT-type nucleotidyltranferase
MSTSNRLLGYFLSRSLGLLLLVLSLTSWAKDPSKCKPLFESLKTGYLSLSHPNFTNTAGALEQELEGLNHFGVLSWRPHEKNDLIRKLIRYHGMDHLAPLQMPKYDKTQKLGLEVVDIKDIRFSQVDCKNGSDGGYTVINNAKAIKYGTLDVSILPKLKVWRDVEGRIWSLDHRRLAAMKLSGALDKVTVEFVPEAEVMADKFKFATQTEGKTIIVRLEQESAKPPMAFVIADEDFIRKATYNAKTPTQKKPTNLVSKPTSEFISGYDETSRKAWLTARGPDHFERLREFASDVASAYKELESREVGKLKLNYDRFGKFSGRGKSADSIYAKLLRKDFVAFSKGQDGITDLKKTLAAVGDGIGARLTFKADQTGKIKADLIQDFVDQVVIDIRTGNRVTEIMNYRAAGPRGVPYLSDAQIKQIVQADAEYIADMKRLKASGREVTVPEPIKVKNGPEATFPDGYTAFHMNIEYKSGVQAEFQVRGPMMNEAAEIKHLFYDLNAGKVLSPSYQKNPEVVKAASDYMALSPGSKERVMDYIEQRLIYAREVETGKIDSTAPKLLESFPQNLSFEYLKPHLIHH